MVDVDEYVDWYVEVTDRFGKKHKIKPAIATFAPEVYQGSPIKVTVTLKKWYVNAQYISVFAYILHNGKPIHPKTVRESFKRQLKFISTGTRTMVFNAPDVTGFIHIHLIITAYSKGSYIQLGTTKNEVILYVIPKPKPAKPTKPKPEIRIIHVTVEPPPALGGFTVVYGVFKAPHGYKYKAELYVNGKKVGFNRNLTTDKHNLGTFSIAWQVFKPDIYKVKVCVSTEDGKYRVCSKEQTIVIGEPQISIDVTSSKRSVRVGEPVNIVAKVSNTGGDTTIVLDIFVNNKRLYKPKKLIIEHGKTKSVSWTLKFNKQGKYNVCVERVY